MGVPARIRLPGGRPKRFKWQSVEQKRAQELPANGQQASNAKV
jgi:hypothetical protein